MPQLPRSPGQPARAEPGGENLIDGLSELDAPPESLRQQVVSGIGWKLATQLILQATRTGTGILLAHLLAPRDYGLAAMALLLSGIPAIFTDLSLGSALIQRRTITEDDRSTAFWTTIALGAFFAALGVLVSPLVSSLFSTPAVAPLFAVASANFLISATSSTQVALLTRELRFRSLQLREIAGLLVGAATAIVIAFAGGGAWAIVGQALASEGIALILVWRFSDWRPSATFSAQSLRVLGSFGGPVALARIFGYLNLNADNFLIGKFLGAVPLGIYALAYNVMFAPLARIAVPIQQVLFPAFSRLRGDPARFGAAWLRGSRLLAAVSVPAFAGLFAVAPDFVTVVLGQRWHRAVPVLELLCVAGAAQSLQSMNWTVLQAAGRAGALLRFMIFSGVVTVGAFGAGVHWGIVGVAAGFAIARTLVLPVFTVIACRAADTTVLAFARSVHRVVELSLGMAAVVYGLRLALDSGGVDSGARLAILVFAGAALYLGGLRWLEPGLVTEARAFLPGGARPASTQ
ncbi:MAG TPA: lipopolysaccharide biosynthesis protein [Gaiellaceae bacterium]